MAPVADLKAPAQTRDPAAASAEPYPRVLVFTTLFPNPAQPRLGVFVRDRVRAVAEHCPTVVVAPILARLPGRRLDLGSTASVPEHETQSGLSVYHPRFTTLPGVGRAADATLLFWQSVAALQQVRSNFAFDVIDAHYAFPDGAAAILLGQHFHVPVCVTLRGGDIDMLPKFRLRRRVIQRTLQRADRVFAVSEHLARGAGALGLPRDRVHVIPNGIDLSKFRRREPAVARRELGIPSERQVLLCVGNLLAEKGQHVLIEALGQLERSSGVAPHLTIIGSNQWGRQQYTKQIERRVTELGLSDRVTFLGSQPQEALAAWYSAVDLVILPTFREGCPNVVREALACGTPVVASNVGGVPELIESEAMGLLVTPGNVSELADAIATALRRQWNRDEIAAIGGRRTWPVVASAVAAELRTVAGSQS